MLISKLQESNSLQQETRAYFRKGEYGIAIFAACLGISLALVGSVMLLILVKGFAHFMPRDLYIYAVKQSDGGMYKVAGEVQAEEKITRQILIESGYTPTSDKNLFSRFLLKKGNREFGRDYQWILQDEVVSVDQDKDLMLIERTSYGNFYGTPVGLRTQGASSIDIPYPRDGGDDRAREEWRQELRQRLVASKAVLRQLGKKQKGINKINYRLEVLRLQERRMELELQASQENLAPLNAEREKLQEKYQAIVKVYEQLNQELNQHELLIKTAGGDEVAINFAQIVRLYQSNQLGVGGRTQVYLSRLVEFIGGQPRESNTEGGVFPAILGTVMMVLLMTIFVMPLGVIAAFYLYIYAQQNIITQAIRVAVNNLAGVPSIVFGMFGLGFFVYTLGGSIDQLLYPEALPTPTFGSGGILWASLTLALLTLPVVIVATEEGLTRIPRHLPEGSMALGATRFETLWKISLPIVSPSIMTGMILAVARATGEVAPLMLVGVVKLAPSMPIDGNFPFLHLDRKFMHLGFHIYDVGFQSPNVEAARPLIFATASLLLLVVILLNALAIIVRNRLRENYKNLS